MTTQKDTQPFNQGEKDRRNDQNPREINKNKDYEGTDQRRERGYNPGQDQDDEKNPNKYEKDRRTKDNENEDDENRDANRDKKNFSGGSKDPVE